MPDLRTHMFRLWFRLSRPMTMGARAIVENAEGQVLLVRHTYTKGLYLPGGGVESGETVYDTIRKELEEEGGIRLTRHPKQIGVFSNHKIMRNDHIVLFHVKADEWTQYGNPIGREISQLLWCNPLSPPEDSRPGTIRRLNEFYGQASRSADW